MEGRLMMDEKKTHWIFWPFVALWRLVGDRGNPERDGGWSFYRCTAFLIWRVTRISWSVLKRDFLPRFA
jgi:hypothetical protein